MEYKEVYQDLFTVPENYYLAHCISADFKMGAGIAVQFNKKFDMKNKLIKKHPNFLSDYDYQIKMLRKSGCCIAEGRVLNLITKRNYWNKPTYKSIEASLKSMKEICLSRNIKFVAMPLIGCGLDRLKWENVSEILKNLFKDTDVKILICKQ